MTKFKFDLKQSVRIIASGEQGIVIGRSEHTAVDNQYNVRYKCGDGRAVEAWWTQTALSAVPVVVKAKPAPKAPRKPRAVKPAAAVAVTK